MPCNGEPSGWRGDAGIDRLPPARYWAHLESTFPASLVAKLATRSDRRIGEFDTGLFAPSEHEEGARLLATFSADGWARCEERYTCSELHDGVTREDFDRGICSRNDDGVLAEELAYGRELPPSRAVEWAIVIHGMNTDGAWQEEFSWYFGTSQGRSVPVAVYKYGRIVTGVVMAFRRQKLKRDLREKLVMLQRQAKASNLDKPPDIVVHSFGTWLVGQILLDEVEAGRGDSELKFGRLILAGCILRPDYPWHKVKDNGLVEDVLLHYGTKDIVVPLAHWTIRDSGPAGRRGFDRDPHSGQFEVVNVKAEGYGHSDLFSVKKCVVNDVPLQNCPEGGGGVRHLDDTYTRYWRPFLTLPRAEFASIPDRADPPKPWKQAWWPLRGTALPYIALPLLLALVVLLIGLAGETLDDSFTPVLLAVIGFGALAVLYVVLVFVQIGWRRWRSRSP